MFSYQAKPEDTLDLARYLNDHIAGVCRQYPTRFIGLGTIPMQSVEHAIPELRRCVLELGLAGIQIGSHVNALMLGDAKLAPIFDEAARLGACIFVHPWDMQGEAMMSKYWLPWLVGMPMETCAAICSLMLSGTFARLPHLRVMFAHGGGSFPGTIGRIEHGYHCRPDLVAIDSPDKTPRQWVEAGSFWTDSLTHDPVALHALVNLLGPERVALGTDYPFPLGEIHMGALIAHMDQEQLPNEHAKPGAPSVRSPLSAEERARWTPELKERLLWKNGLEFLGLQHQEEKFLRQWTAKPHAFTHPELLATKPAAASASSKTDAAAADQDAAAADAVAKLSLASEAKP
jgi:aminocarboxymuconate-semialdehyde decarboxylase